MLWLIVVAAGAYAFSKLEFSLLPDVALPVVVVVASDDSNDARDTERTLTQPLEQALAASEPSTLASTTYPGHAVLRLTYEFGNTLEARVATVHRLLAQNRALGAHVTKVEPIDVNESAVDTFVAPATSGISSSSDIVGKLGAITGVREVRVLGDDPSKAIARLDGKPVIEARLIKRAGGNALAIDKAARAVVPAAGDLQLVVSQAPFIADASHATLEALLVAMAVAALITLPFLRDLRATLISALAIPTSLAGAAIAMKVFHFNLEMITLLALALVTGVIVDDAIVDVENIVRRMRGGDSAKIAAARATDEIWFAVVAATLAIVAVFLPIGFARGNMGQFFKPFGLTASAAVLTSLLVARTLSPALAGVLLSKRGRHEAFAQGRVPQPYAAALSFALARPRTTLLLAVLSVAGGVALVPTIPQGFIPHLDRGDFVVYLTSPLGTPVGEAATQAASLEAVISSDRDVDHVLTTLGDRDDPTRGVLSVLLRADRSATTFQIEQRIRRALPDLPGYGVDVEDTPLVDKGLTKPMRLILSSPDRDGVDRDARRLARKLNDAGGYRDVTVTATSEEFGTLVRIERFKQAYGAYVDANLDGRTIGDATGFAMAQARAIDPDVAINLGGDSASAVNTLRGFAWTLGFSLLCVVVVLEALFRGARPIVIVASTLPLSLLGAMAALALVHADFGIISLLGLIFLLGLSVKNAILLVDAIERGRRAGVPPAQAVREAASVRLRPIVMTTTATVLGMLPIALGFGAGAELRAPMGICIIGGLISSTLFTLVVIPAAYALGIREDAEGRAAMFES